MTTGNPAVQGAALTWRPVIGEAWRRAWIDASLPYLITTSDRLHLLAACRPGGDSASAGPVLVLVDSTLGGQDMIEGLRAAGASILLLSPSAISTPVRVALRAGIDGMITLSDPLVTMRAAIALLTGGDAYASPTAARLLLDEHRLGRHEQTDTLEVVLSGRERAVLQDMVDGLTTKATARHLGISTKTVEAHRSRLFARLRVRSQSEAVTRALADDRLLGPAPTSPPA